MMQFSAPRPFSDITRKNVVTVLLYATGIAGMAFAYGVLFRGLFHMGGIDSMGWTLPVIYLIVLLAFAAAFRFGLVNSEHTVGMLCGILVILLAWWQPGNAIPRFTPTSIGLYFIGFLLIVVYVSHHEETERKRRNTPG